MSEQSELVALLNATIPGRPVSADFFGVCELPAPRGWRVWVFIDAGDWDYIDRVQAPDGRVIGDDNWGEMIPELRNWRPKSIRRWVRVK